MLKNNNEIKNKTIDQFTKLGSWGEHVTPRPPKPLLDTLRDDNLSISPRWSVTFMTGALSRWPNRYNKEQWKTSLKSRLQFCSKKHYLKSLFVVCKVALRTIILRDNIIRKHWWTINNIAYMLQLRYNKSNVVIKKYFYLLMLNKSERHSTGNWT